MRCPYCDNESNVVDSRASSDGVRRRRECPNCRRRFTTYERVGEPNLKVVKRSGKAEPFSSEKMVATLTRICRDRPAIEAADITRLVKTIEANLVDERVKTVPSSHLVELLLDHLQAIDRLAYDRFAVNYLDESGQLRPRGREEETDDDGQLGLFDKGES